MRSAAVALGLFAMLGLAACAPAGAEPGAAASVAPDVVIGGERPVIVQVPDDTTEPAPLLMMLHGYGSDSEQLEAWAHLGDAADERGWIVLAPDGTTDEAGDQFWNAGTPGCCNMFDSDVDDSAYLSGLIAEAAEVAPVDPKRVYLFGHSNGGFMTYRMACDHADQIAAIASFAGIVIPEEICNPSEPVHTLQLHGTLDGSVPYNGTAAGVPSAEEMTALWAAHNGCDPVAETSAPFDLLLLEGDETVATSYTQGCEPGGSSTLWTIDKATHQPAPSASTAGLLLDFLEAHPQP